MSDQTETGTAPERGEKTIPYERFQRVNEQKRAAEAALAELVEELKADIPEDMRDLVPSIPAPEQVKWLRAAMRKGLFGGSREASGPDSKRPGGKPPTDFNTMSAYEKMAHGYKA